MAYNYGKAWEEHFKDYWSKSFPEYLIARLYDQITKYKDVSQNPADYYSFLEDKLIYLECKVTEENTLNFQKFPQLERMYKLSTTYKNVMGYVVIWYKSHDLVVMVSDQEAMRIKNDGNKSINVKLFTSKSTDYNYIIVPTKKLSTLLKCDFLSIKDKILNKEVI